MDLTTAAPIVPTPGSRKCAIEYQGRSGLIALLDRLAMEHRKPSGVAHAGSREASRVHQDVWVCCYVGRASGRFVDVTCPPPLGSDPRDPNFPKTCGTHSRRTSDTFSANGPGVMATPVKPLPQLCVGRWSNPASSVYGRPVIPITEVRCECWKRQVFGMRHGWQTGKHAHRLAN
jgi:hypothetical protein